MAPQFRPGRGAPRRPQARQASQRGKKDGLMRRIVRPRRPPSPAAEQGNDVDGASFPPSVDTDSRPSAPSVVTPRGAAGTNSPIESEVDGGAIYGELGYSSYEEAVAVVYADPDAMVASAGGRESIDSEDEDSSFVLSESEDEGGSTNPFGLLADEAESSDEGSGGGEDTLESEGGGSNSNRFDLLMDESSSSSEESGSELDDDSSSGGLGSNPFNVLVYGESSSEDDRSELTETVCNLSSQHTNDDDSLDDDCAKCAVCWERDDQCDTWQRLLTLPCCGQDGKLEASSSTRFCAACILRMATTKDPSMSSEYPLLDPYRSRAPTGQFYRDDVETAAQRVIECPRCRDLLVVKIERPRSGSKEGGGANPQNAQSISVRIPSFEEKVRYAGKKKGSGGGPVAGMLWRAAFLHHGFMPGVCLGPEADCENLVQWGILQKAPGARIPLPVRGETMEVFRMDREAQASLVDIFDLERVEEGYSMFSEDGSPAQGFEEGAALLCGLGLSIVGFAMSFRLLGAVRMVNRLLTLILAFKGYAPMFPHSTGRQWVVTALNIFTVLALLQFLLVTLLHAGCFLGVGLTVCYFLRHGNNPKAIWWQVVLAAFFAWRLATYVYDSPSLTWLGWVAPKSVVVIKSLLWA